MKMQQEFQLSTCFEIDSLPFVACVSLQCNLVTSTCGDRLLIYAADIVHDVAIQGTTFGIQKTQLERESFHHKDHGSQVCVYVDLARSFDDLLMTLISL